MLNREAAAENNVWWYCTMMQAHGLPFDHTAAYWQMHVAGLPYYSNYIVKDPADPGHMKRIAALKDLGLPRCSLADPFASLDGDALAGLGFELLIEARWYGATGASTRPALRNVDNKAALSDWEARWKQWSPTDQQTMFPPSLLGVDGVAFWEYIGGDGKPAGGALTHSNGSHVGLSNVFVDDQSARGDALRDAARVALSLNPGAPVVGYGSGEEIADLAELGFVDLGPHRVWLANDNR